MSEVKSSHSVFEYVRETLGVHYIPRSAPQQEAAAHSHVIWQHPHFAPIVIFFNQDTNTDMNNPKVSELFQKIVQAMNLDFEKVWFVDSHGRSFMDFLNWLKNQNLSAPPLVVMKNDPDIQNHMHNAGSFDWVECFSLQTMLEKTNLKKPTWEVLKILSEHRK